MSVGCSTGSEVGGRRLDGCPSIGSGSSIGCCGGSGEWVGDNHFLPDAMIRGKRMERKKALIDRFNDCYQLHSRMPLRYPMPS